MLPLNLAMTPVAALPGETLYIWGLAQSLMGKLVFFVVGYFIRRQMEESAAFEEIGSKCATD